MLTPQVIPNAGIANQSRIAELTALAQKGPAASQPQQPTGIVADVNQAGGDAGNAVVKALTTPSGILPANAPAPIAAIHNAVVEPVVRGLSATGAVLGGLFNIGTKFVEDAIPQSVKDTVAQQFGTSGGGLVAPILNKIQDGVTSAFKDDPQGLSTAMNLLNIAMLGLGGEGKKAAEQVATKGSEAVASGASTVADTVSNVVDKVKGPAPTIPSVVGKITQAEPSELSSATRALGTVDTSGVKTFKDLSAKLDETIKTNTAKVDTALGADAKTYKPAVTTNEPVTQGLKQLETYYEKTNDVANLGRIRDLQAKYEGSGLTVKEMNGIAREHGSVLNAYNANGELASGLSRQAAENTRAGIKASVDNIAPDAGRKAIDANTSDLIKTKGMVDDMATKVQQLQNRLKSFTPLQKAGQVVGKTIDTVTGGFFKGLLRQIQGIGTEGATTMNPVELQNALSKNLGTLDKLLKMKPADAAVEIQKLTPK